jgi:hypothetical protein
MKSRMSISRAVQYFMIKKMPPKKLIVPIMFFTVELILIIVLNWQLFGERLAFNTGSEQTVGQVSLHNPLIIVKYLHSDRLTQPFGPDSELSSFFTIPHYTTVVTAFCYLLSLLCACWGLFISTLWVNRFLHNNNLNIVWWVWPAGCFGCHFLLYLLANAQNMISL